MPAVVEVEEKTLVPAPGEPPQTFEGAIRAFRQHIKKMKKQNKLAGEIEREIQTESNNLLREAIRKAYQDQADGFSPHCPICGAKLQNVERREHEMSAKLWTKKIFITTSFLNYNAL